jgi:hypothetical protein
MFTPLRTKFIKAWSDMNDLLDEAARRMQAAHDHYVETEDTNTRNIQKNAGS